MSTEKQQKIDKLTPAQEAAIPEYVKKYTALGLSTKPFPEDKSSINTMIDEVYKNGSQTPPKFTVYLKSPMEAVKFFKYVQTLVMLNDQRDIPDVTTNQVPSTGWEQDYDKHFAMLSDEQKSELKSQTKSAIDNFCYGSHDAGWVAFYDFFRTECNLEGLDKIVPLKNLVGEIGWYLPGSNICMVSQNPTEIYMKDGKLHNSEGPAVKYEDGFAVYAIDGVRKNSLMEAMFGDLQPEAEATSNMIVNSFGKTEKTLNKLMK